MKNLLIDFALVAAASVFCASSGKAEDYSKIRIVRLSFVEGDVQYQRPGQDWQDARLNLPIEEGFALRTQNGYAEVEFEDALALRLGTNSTVEFTELALQDGGRITHLSVPAGTAMISAKLRHGDAVSVVAGNMKMNLPHDARFRMDVSPSDSWVSVFHGKVEVDSGAGNTAQLSSGHTFHDTGNGSASAEIAGNPPQDDFDKWVSHREGALNSAQSETSAVLGNIGYTEGFADLYDYGLWSDIPGYGVGWVPYGVGTGWMPFMDGQWMFMGGLGWDWISAEPWGWLPYHFGSWVNAPGVGWAWLPVGQLSWAPATARWVQANNQLGWIPNGPPQSSKPTKTQLAAIPSTVILATQSTNGAIKAGNQVSLSTLGMNVEPAQAPAFVASSVSAAPSVIGQNQSITTAHTQIIAAPAVLHGPVGAASQVRVAGLTSTPHTMMAPHSAPAPVIARGTSLGGYRGGYGAAAKGGGMVGISSAASPAAAPLGPSTGASAHAGGSSGSGGGHH